MTKPEKKTDRRTLYTRSVIKEAFLNAKKAKDYDAITVTDICRGAEISRGTFYLHYKNLTEILDDIMDDVLASVSSLLTHLELLPREDGCQCAYPLCRFIWENPIYQSVFLDDAFTSHIVKRIAEASREPFQAYMRERSGLSEDEIDTILYFQLSGCLSAIKRNRNRSPEQWCVIQASVDRFIRGGFQALQRERSGD